MIAAFARQNLEEDDIDEGTGRHTLQHHRRHVLATTSRLAQNYADANSCGRTQTDRRFVYHGYIRNSNTVLLVCQQERLWQKNVWKVSKSPKLAKMYLVIFRGNFLLYLIELLLTFF